MQRVALVVALLVPAAGCVGLTDTSIGDVPAPVDVSLSGCREVGIARLVSFEHAQSLLPPGYAPGEAAEFLGMPQPTGRAAVVAGHLACDDSVLDGAAVQWADLLVYTEPPNVPGVNAGDVTFNLYQIAHYTTGAATLALLQNAGFAAFDATVAPTFAVGPEVPVASATLTDADGDVLSFDTAAALPQAYALNARFWHETTNGTLYFEHDRTPITIQLGPVGACAARADSLHARAFGGADCADSDSTGGVFAEVSDFASTFHVLPGVRAAA